MIGIYVIENKLDGKKYIGQSLDIEERFRRHRYREINEHLKNSFKKYGHENFEFKILATIESNDYKTKQEIKNKLNDLEIMYIASFDATNPLKGYNIRKGGTYRINYEVPLSRREKISLSLKGRVTSENVKEKISLSLKGRIANNKGKKQSKETIEKRVRSNTGKKRSEETKKKISKAKIGKKIENCRGKKIICIETSEVFISIKAAERKYNCRGIFSCINGKCKTAAGYRWEYIN